MNDTEEPATSWKRAATALDTVFVVAALITAAGGIAALTDQDRALTLVLVVVGVAGLMALSFLTGWWDLSDEELRSAGDRTQRVLGTALLIASAGLTIVAVLQMVVGDGSWFTRFVLPVYVVVLCIVGVGHAYVRQRRNPAP